MDNLIRFGLMALSGAVAARARRTAQESVSQAVVLLAAALPAACAFACAAAALWVAVAPSLGLAGAWLVTAAAFAGASVAVLLGLWLWTARTHHAIDPPVANELANWFGAHEWLLIAAFLFAGFLSGRRRKR